MSDSLQDQLRALGLAREKQAQRPKNKPKTTAKKAAKKQGSGEVSLVKAYALRVQEEQKQADRARQRKKAEDRRRRQLNNDIRAIVDKHRLNDPAAEIGRNFMYKGRIRKIMVNPDQLKSLNAGELGVVYLSGGYHLLDPEHTAAVRALSEDHVPELGGGDEPEDEEFPVPDDLIW